MRRASGGPGHDGDRDRRYFMYKIEIDEPRRLIRIRLSGFWDEAEMDRYERDLEAAYRKVKTLGSPSAALIDLRESQPQSAKVVERFDALVFRFAPLMPDRVALLTPSALLKRQVERGNARAQSPSGIFFD
jgi:hypothetical protein